MHQLSDDHFFSRNRFPTRPTVAFIWGALLLLSTSASVAQPSPPPNFPRAVESRDALKPGPVGEQSAVAQPSPQADPKAPPALNPDPKLARIPVQPNPAANPPQGAPQSGTATNPDPMKK